MKVAQEADDNANARYTSQILNANTFQKESQQHQV